MSVQFFDWLMQLLQKNFCFADTLKPRQIPESRRLRLTQPNGSTAILHLKSYILNLKVIAIEQSSKSIPYTEADYEFPIALVVGNETRGVSKETLEISDQIVELPLFGVNVSLNVIVSLAIVLYKSLERNK